MCHRKRKGRQIEEKSCVTIVSNHDKNHMCRIVKHREQFQLQ